MRIELEEILKESLKDGVNLFLGAGFSLDAKNIKGETFMLGSQLAADLSEKFNAPKLDLTKISSIIESRDKERFYNYLREKFTVQEYNLKYHNLGNIKIDNIYTTNIDDLLFKIFENSTKYYINDTTLQGPSFRDRSAINYYPLHGCILNKERPMVFSSLAVASSFSANPKLWNDLVRSIETRPTIFWGYSLNDPGILETLNTVYHTGMVRSERWIILHKESPDDEEYFKSLGFNVIIASNIEFLNYLDTFKTFNSGKATKQKRSTKDLLGEEFVPANPSNVPVREINEFYLGAAPTWSDIFRPDMYKTSHFRLVQNSIFSKNNTIIIGIAGSGKTTLMMQLAAFTDFDGHKIILEYPTVDRANHIINRLGSEKAIVFIDNFTEEVESFLLFHNLPNITLVGIDREHNFEIISHLIDKDDFDILSVTSLTSIDIQEIFSRIPQTLKAGHLKAKKEFSDDDPSLFEFVNLNLSIPNINDRYKTLLDKLAKEDVLLAEFLVLASYVHYCRTPLSFDMVYSYFNDDVEDYEEIYELRDKLGALLVDNAVSTIEDDSQDYFSTRSVILSEVIIEHVKSSLLKEVLTRFIDNLPPYKVIGYKTFRKKGHDKYIVSRAFPNWEEGKNYYEKLLRNDPNNPFLLQQGALYLSFKQQHNEAFYWIDKARNMTRDSILSIRNSHAIILFEANIKKQGSEVKNTLDKSMQILKDCYKEDKRKLYHAKKYAEQSLEYFDRYGDDKALEYLDQAKYWLDEEIKINGWHRGLRNLLRELRQRGVK